MTDSDYPTLFRVSDAASLRSQNIYLRLQQIHLGSLVIGSFVGALVPLTGSYSQWLLGAAAIILVLGLITLWVSRAQRYDANWFDCRAVAESVKTTAWRFMMRTPPFEADASVDAKFVSQLKEIREARPGIARYLAQQLDAAGSEITSFMRETRSRPFDTRRSFYLQQRVRDQRSWYSNKAKACAGSSTLWFWMTAGLQVIAAILAIIQAVAGGLGFNVVPIVTTCAAAVAAWNQMKRHDELAQSYTLAAQELGELETLVGGATNEGDFPQLVEQVEEAISREHTMWCARRDVAPPRRIRVETR